MLCFLIFWTIQTYLIPLCKKGASKKKSNITKNVWDLTVMATRVKATRKLPTLFKFHSWRQLDKMFCFADFWTFLTSFADFWTFLASLIPLWKKGDKQKKSRMLQKMFETRLYGDNCWNHKKATNFVQVSFLASTWQFCEII